jgi:signal transduction histidine kinase
MLEAVGSYAVVLNEQRQILAANPVLLEALAEQHPASSDGLRLGEAFGCIRVAEGPDGCGTSKACRRCGALLSVLATQGTGESTEGECLLSLEREGRWEACEFAVRSIPLTVAGHRLILLTLQDISALKRRESLERIFIHDLSNSLQGLQGWAEMLQAAGADAQVVAERILDMASHLTAEVASQRRLLQAESGELVTDIRSMSPEHILDELESSLSADVRARLIRLPRPAGSTQLRTDPAILCRVLGNMVMNAVEALPMGGQAEIWYEQKADVIAFIVQNPGCLPPEVVDRVFQRSFSTKAKRGRGLGTYGMKLLGETVLGGKVGFTTDWTDGTRFYIELPANV